MATAGPACAKLAANWIGGEVSAYLNRASIDITGSQVSADQLGGLLTRIHDQSISGTIAKDVFEAMWNREGDADAIIERDGLRQVNDSGEIEKLIDGIIENNPHQVAQFKSGKEKVFGFFVGQAMKLSKGKANPKQVNELLRAKLAD